jgi:large subunit ribosomal protein L10
MSKAIKQMEMDALKQSFGSVREYVVLSIKGLGAQADHQLRMNLRKKNIRVQMVKNTLTRRVFGELGMNIPAESPYWQGTTWLAFGPESAGELSRDIDTLVRKNLALKDKVTIKGGIAEGHAIPFDQMLTMPSKAEALGMIVSMILGPAAQIASQITGPASQIAGQVKAIADKKEETPPPPAA